MSRYMSYQNQDSLSSADESNFSQNNSELGYQSNTSTDSSIRRRMLNRAIGRSSRPKNQLSSSLQQSQFRALKQRKGEERKSANSNSDIRSPSAPKQRLSSPQKLTSRTKSNMRSRERTEEQKSVQQMINQAQQLNQILRAKETDLFIVRLIKETYQQVQIAGTLTESLLIRLKGAELALEEVKCVNFELYQLCAKVLDLVYDQESHRPVTFQFQESLDDFAAYFTEIQDSGSQIAAVEKQIQGVIQKITVRRLTDMNKQSNPCETVKEIFVCLLILFTDVDKTIEININTRVITSKLWETARKTLIKPGNIVQNLRKYTQFTKNGRISYKVVRIVNERISKLTEENIKKVDSSGLMLAIFYFLKESIRFYEQLYGNLLVNQVIQSANRSSSNFRASTPTGALQRNNSNDSLKLERQTSNFSRQVQLSNEQIPVRIKPNVYNSVESSPKEDKNINAGFNEVSKPIKIQDDPQKSIRKCKTMNDIPEPYIGRFGVIQLKQVEEQPKIQQVNKEYPTRSSYDPYTDKYSRPQELRLSEATAAESLDQETAKSQDWENKIQGFIQKYLPDEQVSHSVNYQDHISQLQSTHSKILQEKEKLQQLLNKYRR